MKLNSKTVLATLGALMLIGGVVVYNKAQTNQYIEQQKQMVSSAKNGAKQSKKAGATKASTVEVIKVVPQDYALSVTGYGEVTAHYELALTSDVGGKIIKISPNFESGRAVKKGDVLAQIESSAYQKALASAKSSLASAQTTLLEEQRQGSQAKKEWKRSGLKGKPSSLVLREPQLKEAQAAFAYQKAAVKSAQYDLNQTKIRAPFDGIIISRDIELGTIVQSSTNIAQIESSDYVEARILLSENKWLGLPDYHNTDLAKESDLWPAVLSNDRGSWDAYVTRIESHIETDSRQRALIIQVKDPYTQQNPLYSGSFVSANIMGKTLNSVWKLPASSLFQGEGVWVVNKKSMLKKHKVKVLFSQADDIYVEPFTKGEVQIVTKPLNYFKENNKVMIKGSESKKIDMQKAPSETDVLNKAMRNE